MHATSPKERLQAALNSGKILPVSGRVYRLGEVFSSLALAAILPALCVPPAANAEPELVRLRHMTDEQLKRWVSDHSDYLFYYTGSRVEGVGAFHYADLRDVTTLVDVIHDPFDPVVSPRGYEVPNEAVLV